MSDDEFYTHAHANPYGNITFAKPWNSCFPISFRNRIDGHEWLRIELDGSVYVKGELTDDSVRIHTAIREWAITTSGYEATNSTKLGANET